MLYAPSKRGRQYVYYMAFLTTPGMERNHLTFLIGDQELEVHTATYGPENDQSQHAKSVSHIIISYSMRSRCSERFLGDQLRQQIIWREGGRTRRTSQIFRLARSIAKGKPRHKWRLLRRLREEWISEMIVAVFNCNLSSCKYLSETITAEVLLRPEFVFPIICNYLSYN